MIGITRYLPSSGLFWRGAILVLSNGIGQALGFIASVAIARILGVQGFGVYAAIMALVFVLGLLVEAGLETTLTREIAEEPSLSRALLAHSLVIKLCLGSIVSLLLGLAPIAFLVSPDASVLPALQIAGPLLTLNALNSSYGAVFRAWGRMEYVLFINISGLGTQLAGILTILTFSKDIRLLILWMVLVQVLELLVGTVLFRRDGRGTDRRPGENKSVSLVTSLRRLLKRSWPFALAGVLGALTLRTDLFILEAIRGPVQVGLYSVGTRLNDLLALAPNSFFAALLPAMSAQHSGAMVNAHRDVPGSIYTTAVRNMAITGASLALFGLVFADIIVWLCFGPLYSSAAWALRVLMFGLIPLLVNRTSIVRLYATRREHKANIGLLLNLAVRSLICASLVPLWGAVGAAVGAVSAELVLLLFFAVNGAMEDTGFGTYTRDVARRVSRKTLALRFRNFTPGAQPDHQVQVGGISLQVYRSVFDPKLHFTSAFLAEYLQKPGSVKPASQALDMGTGSGIAAIAAARAGAHHVVATDINPEAVRAASENARRHNLADQIRAVQGDMFAPVKGERFDLIITNPPYLRGTAESVAALAYLGGPALEWFDRFASGAETHLLPGGSVLMVLGDIADAETILKRFSERGWVVNVAAHKALIVEALTIYSLVPKEC